MRKSVSHSTRQGDQDQWLSQMAKYRNQSPHPGSYIPGYEFFKTGTVAEFTPDVVPNRNWVPLDDEAVECLRKIDVDAKLNDDAHVDTELRRLGPR